MATRIMAAGDVDAGVEGALDDLLARVGLQTFSVHRSGG